MELRYVAIHDLEHGPSHPYVVVIIVESGVSEVFCIYASGKQSCQSDIG